MPAELKPLHFGITAGIVWGLGVLMLGLMATFASWGNAAVETIGSVYTGYEATLTGSIIGMIWAFVDASIAAAIFAYIYNFLVRRIK